MTSTAIFSGRKVRGKTTVNKKDVDPSSIFKLLPQKPVDGGDRSIDSELIEMAKLNSELIKIITPLTCTEKLTSYNKVVLAISEFCVSDIELIISTYANSPAWTNKPTDERQSFIKTVIENNNSNDNEEIDPFTPSFKTKGFHVDSSGIYKEVWEEVLNDYKHVLISKTPFIITKIGESLDDTSSRVIKYKIKYKSITGRILDEYIEPSELLSSDINKKLANLGIVLIDDNPKQLKKYVINFLDTSNNLPIEYLAFKNGWYNNNSMLVTGEYAYTQNGREEINQLSDFLAPMYGIKGNKTDWYNGVKKFLEYDLTWIKMYATVASFCIRFLNINSYVLNNWHESTGAKSMSMCIGGSLIGNPSIEGLIQDAKSTPVGIEKYLEFNSDTPVYYDETSNNVEFKNYIYMMANGKGKGRGNKENTYSVGGSWHTIIQTTGEMALTKDESTLTGIKMRVIELHEAIPMQDQKDVLLLKNTLVDNYGLFLDEIIKKIFSYKHKLRKLYEQLEMFFEKSISVFSERMKAYFVVLAVGGYILDEVFRENGIPTKDSIDVCTKYYKKVVLEDPTTPYSELALSALYQWTVRNLSKFERSKKDFVYDGLAKGAIEVYGWITKDAIYYDETMSRMALEKMGFIFSKAKEDWKNGIVEPYMKNGKIQSYTNQSTINGKSIKGIKIKVSTLRDKLGMDENILEVSGNEEIKEYDEMSIEEKCNHFLCEHPKYKTIEYTSEQAVNEMARLDAGLCLTNGKSYIVEKMDLCKRGCRAY